ncbi:uncharacterized protein LOC127245485 [Andrographis paniculata]|uniref:uncharacterized protein LOC127245485 n=1 Tax=Andrographis paniculata TaxID=175694 RepID=UPI0021E7D829|nr:uncharacterized protein LOC127245485 [Andrographis paniculata]
MKNKMRSKVHPYKLHSHISDDVLSLLPAAILAVVSALPADDLEVLLYMLTRSIKSTTTTTTPQCCRAATTSPPLSHFDCDCFHCYTAFWLRWDSSPNRHLIHRAIDAVEDRTHHSNRTKTRRKDKIPRRKTASAPSGEALHPPATESPATREDAAASEKEKKDPDFKEVERTAEVQLAPAAPPSRHKALARKVLPDVIGIFSSPLWSLWSPKVTVRAGMSIARGQY